MTKKKDSKQSDQQIFHNFADEYQDKKKDTMISILTCGKILFEAKEIMPHGMFGTFLEDVRVAESERTAQRLMVIYKNFRHLLEADNTKKMQALTQLGVSHLLELKNLPDRFKKEIEVIKVVGGEEVKETATVVDEEKLSDFLEAPVPFEGKQVHIRELPLNEMKKYIKEAQGIYEADDPYEAPEISEPIKEQPKEIRESKSKIAILVESLERYDELSIDIMKQVENVDYADIVSDNDDIRDKLKTKLKKTISDAEGVIVKIMGLKDKL